jgi:hypothetical protein
MAKKNDDKTWLLLALLLLIAYGGTQGWFKFTFQNIFPPGTDGNGTPPADDGTPPAAPPEVPPYAPGSDPVNGGYASCEAWQLALGKHFYVTGAGIGSIDECGDYGQSYCQQFGGVPPVLGGVPPWYLVAYDWDTHDCCIFECSGHW